MTFQKFSRLVASTAVIVDFPVVGTATAAEVKVFADRPLTIPLLKIGETFFEVSGHNVAFVFGPSPDIERRIAGGEPADLVIIQPSFVSEFLKIGKVVEGEHPIIARVGVGIAVRAGQAIPNVSTSSELTATLISADTIIFNNVASGSYFATVLDKLGIADTAKKKIVRLPPADTFKRALQGAGKDLVIGTIPQILATEGLQLAGPLPPEHQVPITYAIAPMTGAIQSPAAAALVSFVKSAKANEIFKSAAGVD